ncbi:MAG: GAF domain-containing sensor histidine kinase [Candidatus Omnitrophica bacterium]|nr:GAF domain-containing sensor histidine kinase [Candidatus Omnitrophota bacterium]
MQKNAKLIFFPIEVYNNMDIYPFKNQLKDFLGTNLDRCMQAVNARSGSIFLLDRSRKELVLEVIKNGKKQKLEGLRAKLGEGVSGKVAVKRKPLLVKNIDREPSLKAKTNGGRYKSKSFLSVPLEASGNLIGVVNLNDKSKDLPFSDKDLNTVSIICKYLGSALSSLMMYLETQKQINEDLSKELVDSKKDIDRYKKFSSLGKFVGGLVHEINNPLDGVIRYINLSLDSAQDDTVLREYLLEAKKGMTRIAKFVRSLLDFSWSLSSPGMLVDVNKALYECLFQFQHHFRVYNIATDKYFSDNLPRIPDYGLKIVFNNLIKNACEAMKEKGGTFIVSTYQVRDSIVITFKDTGPGIKPEVQDKIFDPFFTTKSMGEGSGLGLAISYEIISRYAGQISLESTPQAGTTFTVTLPVSNKKEFVTDHDKS